MFHRVEHSTRNVYTLLDVIFDKYLITGSTIDDYNAFNHIVDVTSCARFMPRSAQFLSTEACSK